ncbi:hypothetical protein DL766_007333 [Monosporascus sp. MC13-8B]|uniref:Enoyl reductase (ER) domain-containing protein n=1 Tax=Monosporascus cannonballus TaxID=155416 RepID=A0ABY0GV96_9PEZI|nr:hypothetical protein DL763_010294 [Monosporascus cannonballus]RYO75120.1 hypothetical protein DL762_010173 [Monosporascus cannonballus]RYP24261.1 hypothetical protein DL766_007333 [Monosporascus sp. MC13-8B]
MSQPIPKTTKQWNVTGPLNGLGSLRCTKQAIPELSDNQVLVRIQGASINYRDVIILQGKYPFDLKPSVVAGSDRAGTVLAVGKHVTRFKSGDKVVTTVYQHHLAGPIDSRTRKSGLGGSIDGTLRSVGAFDEQGLVAIPEGLSFTEAATLSCAGVTAWNALFGPTGKHVTAGQWVLTQGTGGVSLFPVQFAKAVGARVIATTSSSEKAKGSVAKELTGGVGVDHVVDVAGRASLEQSAASVKLDGVISVVGFVGGAADANRMPGLLDCWMNHFLARGIWAGSRMQMEDMCRAIAANPDKLRPVVDPRVFTLDQVKEAYEYLESGKHQGKEELYGFGPRSQAS